MMNSQLYPQKMWILNEPPAGPQATLQKVAKMHICKIRILLHDLCAALISSCFLSLFVYFWMPMFSYSGH